MWRLRCLSDIVSHELTNLTNQDEVVSDNKDMVKVLATVAETVYTFTRKHPESWVLIKGNTPIRTRLYQMAISNNMAGISEDFGILGLKKDNQWQIFEKNQEYKSFLITRKWNLK